MKTSITPSAHGTHADLLGLALERYFCRYLIDQRQLSPKTIATYRDTFKLLLEFMEHSARIKPDHLCVRDLDAPRVLAFLDYLERTRRNSPRSRNLRLAVVRSFMRHAAAVDPLLLSVAQRVLAIPIKRFERTVVKHLTPTQILSILNAPNTSTWVGFRDRVLLTILYNTGARVSEVAALNVGDLQIDISGSLHLHGKGRKQRTVPLWRESVRLLRRWRHHIDPSPQAPLLPNALGGRITRSGIEYRLRVALKKAAAMDVSLRRLRVSPHAIRHTTAMHMLQSGVDLSVIAMWLGHESLQTTHQYLNADLASKRQALDHLKAPPTKRPTIQRPQRIIQFLQRL